jgi:N-acetylmuramoyl-L-alanine amidase
VLWHPSPNFGARRGGVVPDLIVLHYTAMKSAVVARDWLCVPASEVSCHYVVAEDGCLWHLVRDEDRAWHAGAGAWGDVSDVNSHSLGIELANRGTHPFAEPQMAVLETLLRQLCARWTIPPERVIGHSDMAPGRKIDPGARFDWRRLARQDLSIWYDPRPGRLDEGRFWQDCRRFGYDPAPERHADVLNAVRLRFRPWASGPLDAQDCAILSDLASRFPCREGVDGVRPSGSRDGADA